MAEERVVKTICQACHCECGVLAYVKDGKVVKIEGDPEFPQNKGGTCVKALAYHQLVYHPNRLLYPMKRVGEKGEGKWQRISWDEALDTICAKWQEIIARDGPQAIANFYQDSPRTHFLPYVFLNRAIGSPNVFGCLHICYCPTIQAEANTYGGFITHEHGPDFENSKCLLIWGANPVMTHPLSAAWHIFEGKHRGAKMIVVDPRFTETAAKADLWLQVRPATDGALALGMLNVIINEELHDKEFVDKWCLGFEELKERVQQYPPDKVAEITWVPKEKIIQAARMFATNRPAAQHHRVAVEQFTNSFGALRALSILVAITGNLDVKGGNIFTTRPKHFKSEPRLYSEALRSIPREVWEKQVGVKEFPLFVGPDSQSSATPSPLAMKAILRGEIKSIFGVANLLLSAENAKREVLPALKKLEFSWFPDFFMNPTMEYADVILPAATWLEVDDIANTSYLNYVGVRRKVIEPLGEAKDDKWIAIEIAKRMGVTDKFVSKATTIEEYLDYQLKDMGLTFDQLRKAEKNYIERDYEYKRYEKSGRFLTPSGKVELSSTMCKKFGLDPLPAYHEPHESYITTPELAKEYPLIGIFGVRHIAFMHAANREIPWLRELHPDPTIEIHPKTAEELGIKDGDWVWIETPRAKDRVKQKAKLTLGIHPKVICAEPFWWFPERGGPEYGCWESNINVITSGDPPYDPVVGSTLIRGGLCQIYKVEN